MLFGGVLDSCFDEKGFVYMAGMSISEGDTGDL